MIYGLISAHNSQHRDDPSLFRCRIQKGTCPLRCSTRRTQVLAVKFDQLERVEHGGVVVLPGADQVKAREATLIDSNRLAVDEHDRTGKFSRAATIMGKRSAKSVAGDEPHARNVPRCQDAKAVMLDLLNLAGAPGGFFAGRGMQGSKRRRDRSGDNRRRSSRVTDIACKICAMPLESSLTR